MLPEHNHQPCQSIAQQSSHLHFAQKNSDTGASPRRACSETHRGSRSGDVSRSVSCPLCRCRQHVYVAWHQAATRTPHRPRDTTPALHTLSKSHDTCMQRFYALEPERLCSLHACRRFIPTQQRHCAMQCIPLYLPVCAVQLLPCTPGPLPCSLHPLDDHWRLHLGPFTSTIQTPKHLFQGHAVAVTPRRPSPLQLFPLHAASYQSIGVRPCASNAA